MLSNTQGRHQQPGKRAVSLSLLSTDTHDLFHRCGSQTSLKRVLLSRHGRDSDRHDELGIHHSMEHICASSEFQVFARLSNNIRNVPLYLLPVVRLQIRLTKARSDFSFTNKSVDSNTVSNFRTPNYWSDGIGQTPPYCWLIIRHLTQGVSRGKT